MRTVALGEVLKPSRNLVRVDDPDSAKLISVKLHGLGAVRRQPGEGKAPKPFTGNRGRAGQFVFSRIWARRGAMALIPEDLDGVVVTNEFPLFDIDADRLEPRYFIRLVQQSRFISELDRVSAGASGQNRVKEAAFLGLSIPLPPLDEQRRIAAILDQADAIRTKRRQVLAHLDSLTQAIFHEMFGGSVTEGRPLALLIDPDDKINYGVVQPGDAVPEGVPLVRVSNLIDGSIDRSELKLIDPSIEHAYARSRLKGNEILVSCVGSIGSVALVSKDDIGSNIARAISRIPISDRVLRNYVAAYLGSDEAQRYFASEVRLVAQPTLNVKQLSELMVPVVARDRMDVWMGRLEQANRAIAIQKCALAADDALFASLQSRAFNGER